MFKNIFMLLLGIILGITTSISIAFAWMLKVVFEERNRAERKTKFNYSRL